MIQQLLLRGLVAISLLFSSNALFAQENGASQVDDTSARYVEPTTGPADVNMITPPATFEVSDAFNGYLSKQLGSAIIMLQINNVTYVQVCDGMTDEFFQKNKLTYISDESFVSDHGIKGRYYKSSFQADGQELIRYTVYAGDLEKTLWLNITYPKMIEEIIEDEVLKSIQSVTLNPSSHE